MHWRRADRSVRRSGRSYEGVLHRIAIDIVPRDCTGAEATQRRQIAAYGCALCTTPHPFTGIIGQPGESYLVEVEITECSMKLAKARAVSLLRPWLQTRQVIDDEPFQSVFVVSTRTPSTIQPTMFFQHSCEELLCNRLGRGAGRSPDLLASPLKAYPVGGITLVDGRHDRCSTPSPSARMILLAVVQQPLG
jgi:hypothetical protein